MEIVKGWFIGISLFLLLTFPSAIFIILFLSWLNGVLPVPGGGL